jgi:hypothetical protein
MRMEWEITVQLPRVRAVELRTIGLMDQLPFLLNHLATCIERSYGLRIRRIVPLPLGHAGATWIFRAETDRDTYFVKVKQSLPETGIRVSQQLLGMGVPVAVPLDSQSGTPWAQCDGLYLLLFPFIGGRPFEAETARSEQWKNLGAVLSRIHSASLPPSLLDVLEKETFLPYGSGFLKKVETAASSHVALPEFRHLWRDSRGLMAEFFARVQDWARMLSVQTRRGVSAMVIFKLETSFRQNRTVSLSSIGMRPSGLRRKSI